MFNLFTILKIGKMARVTAELDEKSHLIDLTSPSGAVLREDRLYVSIYYRFIKVTHRSLGVR